MIIVYLHTRLVGVSIFYVELVQKILHILYKKFKLSR